MKTLWVKRLPRVCRLSWAEKMTLLGKDPTDWVEASCDLFRGTVHIPGISGGWDIEFFETSEHNPTKITLEELL